MEKPPTGLREFTLFPDLPVEIQLTIFEWAIPMRLFILLAYPGRRLRPDPADPTSRPHAPQFSWVVHPRSAVVPALLHTCRRSRDFLLRSGVYEPAPASDPHVRFSSPVVAYGHDVFAVLPNNPRLFRRRTARPKRHGLPQLVGVDRARIRHAAWFQTTLRPPLAGHYFARSGLARLPALQSLMLIETEYVGRKHSGGDSAWLRATTSLTLGRVRPESGGGSSGGGSSGGGSNDNDDVFLVLPDQTANYELLEIPLDREREALGILAHFGVQPADCYANRSAVWTRQMQDFYAATYLARACLWHQHHTPAAHTNVAAGEAANNDYQTLLDCLHVPAWDAAPCPICALPAPPSPDDDNDDNDGTAAVDVHALGGHTMADLRYYEPPFELRYGYLCRTPQVEFVAQNGFRILFDGPPQRDPKDALRYVTDMQRLKNAW